MIQKQLNYKLLAGYVKNEIEEMILSGKFKPGDQLPSEIIMSQEMGVSRATLREAAKLLENAGLLIRQNGLGTFVKLPHPFLSGNLESNFSLSDEIKAVGLNIETVSNTFEERYPTPKERQKLNLKFDSKIFCVYRTRVVEGKPIVTSTDILPTNVITREDLNKIGNRSLYRILEDCGNIVEIGEAELHSTIATKVHAKQLNIDLGTPLLIIEQLDYDIKKRPLLYSKEFYISERITFNIRRQRNIEQFAFEYLEKNNNENR